MEQEPLELEPGQYVLDEPVYVGLSEHTYMPWGIYGLGVTFICEYEEAKPAVTIEGLGNAELRFLSMDLFQIRGKNRKQNGVALVKHGTSGSIYDFVFNRVSVEGCDDAFYMEGDVFEGDIYFCAGRDCNNGLALGNDLQGNGILSQINVWGGWFAQNKVDGVRTFGPQYREPYDFTLNGTYCGNNGRYAVNAMAGCKLLKAVRMENPWSDIATHDPDNDKERAALHFNNFANLEQCDAGGNGNCTTMAHGYLSGNITFKDCRLWGGAQRLARLDGNPQVHNRYYRINSAGEIVKTAAVHVGLEV
jgi:hypothetical protein